MVTKRRKKAEALAPEAPAAPPGRAGPNAVWLGSAPAGVRVNEDTALTLGAVFGCVRVVSEDLAALPWGVYERRTGGGRTARPEDPADWLIDVEANPETPAFQFRETLIAHALTWGNGYAEIERDGAGRPAWLWQLTPDRVEPERATPDVIRAAGAGLTGTAPGELVYKVHNQYANPTYLAAADVFHLRGLGFDGLKGYSVIRLAARSIGVGIAADESTASVYANDSTPGGYLSHKGRLSDPARLNLRKTWQGTHGGPSRRRTIGILEEGMTWEQTALDPEDIQLLQQRQFTPAEVCRWFRVKPHKIADLSRATFSNIEQQSIEHVVDTLLPWGKRLETEANVKLFGRTNRGKKYTKLNYNALLRGDAAARGTFYTTMLDRGIFSVNEVRELEDMNPIGPDGDKRFVQANMQLLEKAGEEPPPPKAPPFGGPPKAEPSANGEAPPDGKKKAPDGETPAARMRAALMPLVADGCARLARWQEHRVKEADGEPFDAAVIARLAAHARETLGPSAAALARAAGCEEGAGASALWAFVDDYAARLAADRTARADPENLARCVLAACVAARSCRPGGDGAADPFRVARF